MLDFSRTELRVVVADRPPFVFVANTSAGTTIYGLLVDLLNKILSTSNATLSYSLYVAPENAGGTLTEAGWNGVVGELVYGRADVALFPLTRTAPRLTAIDCTFSYLDQGIGLAVTTRRYGAGLSTVLAPFSVWLWVALLGTAVAVAVLFWILEAYGKWIRAVTAIAWYDDHGGDEAGATRQQAAVCGPERDDRNPVLLTFIAAAGAPERPAPSSWGVQVLYIVYCFFCLIVLSSYTANLTSLFMVWKNAGTKISGLQDLVDTGALLAVIPNGTNAAYFTSSYDSLAMRLKDNVRFCGTDACLRWLRDGTVAAFASNMPQLAYLAKQRPCDLAVVGGSFGPGNLVIGLQKDSPLTPLFNAAIQRFQEDGTLSALQRAWSADLDQCARRDTVLYNDRLGTSQMLGAFGLVCAGTLVSFAVASAEGLKGLLVRAYARARGGDTAQVGPEPAEVAIEQLPSCDTDASGPCPERSVGPQAPKARGVRWALDDQESVPGSARGGAAPGNAPAEPRVAARGDPPPSGAPATNVVGPNRAAPRGDALLGWSCGGGDGGGGGAAASCRDAGSEVVGHGGGDAAAGAPPAGNSCDASRRGLPVLSASSAYLPGIPAGSTLAPSRPAAPCAVPLAAP